MTMSEPHARPLLDAARRQILRLPEHVVERIAAGEVIERPASVVRELIENALDALASTIRIEMRDGGLRFLRVADDGHGISPEDLALACQPHTTSKVSTLDDLEHIGTLGFRGEALASIAAVAEVEIASASDDAGLANVLTLEGAGPPRQSQISRPRGTTVTVRNLFAGVPARKAMLRRPTAEGARVAALVRQYALLHPEVRFTLVADGMLMLQTSGATSKDAIASVYGSDVARSVVEVGPEHIGGAGISGFVSPPPFDVADRRHVLVAVNGRPIANRALLSAAEAGYRPLLKKGRHPILVLAITVPPDELDANLHPAKAEVLLRHEQAIGTAIRSCIYASLGSAKAARTVNDHSRASLAPSVQLRLPIPRQRRGLALGESRTRYQPPAITDDKDIPDLLPELEPLGQVDDTLIIARSRGGHLYLIDQHRAHERILYETLATRLPSRTSGAAEVSPGNDGESTSGQMLLMPVLVELTARQADLLLPRLDELAAIGFECQHFGGAVFLVRSLPTLSETTVDSGALARALVQEASEDTNDWLEHLRTSLACRSAIRRGQPLAIEEQKTLLDGLRATTAPARCPHGSPLILHYGPSFLARAFEW